MTNQEMAVRLEEIASDLEGMDSGSAALAEAPPTDTRDEALEVDHPRLKPGPVAVALEAAEKALNEIDGWVNTAPISEAKDFARHAGRIGDICTDALAAIARARGGVK